MTRSYKVVVVGDSSVGKTCLSRRFCEEEFPDYEPQATVGVEFYRKNVNVNGWRCVLQLWDTAGQEKNRRDMVSVYYRKLRAIAFVYDVNDIETFNNVPVWITECKNHYSGKFEDVPRVLVGNKADSRNKVAVTSHMAKKFADLHNMSFFEVSAMTSTQIKIDEIFTTLARLLKDQEPKEQPIKEPESFKIKATDKPVHDTSSGDCCNC